MHDILIWSSQCPMLRGGQTANGVVNSCDDCDPGLRLDGASSAPGASSVPMYHDAPLVRLYSTPKHVLSAARWASLLKQLARCTTDDKEGERQKVVV